MIEKLDITQSFNAEFFECLNEINTKGRLPFFLARCEKNVLSQSLINSYLNLGKDNIKLIINKLNPTQPFNAKFFECLNEIKTKGFLPYFLDRCEKNVLSQSLINSYLNLGQENIKLMNKKLDPYQMFNMEFFRYLGECKTKGYLTSFLDRCENIKLSQSLLYRYVDDLGQNNIKLMIEKLDPDQMFTVELLDDWLKPLINDDNNCPMLYKVLSRLDKNQYLDENLIETITSQFDINVFVKSLPENQKLSIDYINSVIKRISAFDNSKLRYSGDDLTKMFLNIQDDTLLTRFANEFATNDFKSSFIDDFFVKHLVTIDKIKFMLDNLNNPNLNFLKFEYSYNDQIRILTYVNNENIDLVINKWNMKPFINNFLYKSVSTNRINSVLNNIRFLLNNNYATLDDINLILKHMDINDYDYLITPSLNNGGVFNEEYFKEYIKFLNKATKKYPNIILPHVFYPDFARTKIGVYDTLIETFIRGELPEDMLLDVLSVQGGPETFNGLKNILISNDFTVKEFKEFFQSEALTVICIILREDTNAIKSFKAIDLKIISPTIAANLVMLNERSIRSYHQEVWTYKFFSYFVYESGFANQELNQDTMFYILKNFYNK
jgi:hypothetical protein